MTFKSENITVFEQIFEDTKPYIQSFEGCNSVELLQDIKDPNAFFTYSIWESEDHLNNYRNSDFFKVVWGKTKQLFDTKPEAWSTYKKT
jgi:heme-degrading monooxygenase HmoA